MSAEAVQTTHNTAKDVKRLLEELNALKQRLASLQQKKNSNGSKSGNKLMKLLVIAGSVLGGYLLYTGLSTAIDKFAKDNKTLRSFGRITAGLVSLGLAYYLMDRTEGTLAEVSSILLTSAGTLTMVSGVTLLTAKEAKVQANKPANTQSTTG